MQRETAYFLPAISYVISLPRYKLETESQQISQGYTATMENKSKCDLFKTATPDSSSPINGISALFSQFPISDVRAWFLSDVTLISRLEREYYFKPVTRRDHF